MRIRTREQHRQVLEEIERLWSCEVGAEEFERFYILTKLVQDWERQDSYIPHTTRTPSLVYHFVDWQREVARGHTVLGYKDWVVASVKGENTICKVPIVRAKRKW